MKPPLSPAAQMFEKVLRAFETHGIAYADVLARLRQLLATGASPNELLAILRRREATEQLPQHTTLEALLIEAAEQEVPAAEEPQPAAEPSTTAAGVAESATTRQAELDLSTIAEQLRAFEERMPAQAAALEALTRSYDRAREAEAAAAQRAAGYAAELGSVQNTLQTEQRRVRELELAQAQSIAAEEAASATARRELRRLEAELQRAQAELQQSQAEAEANLATTRTALEAEQARARELARALNESVTAGETARAAALRESQRAQAELQQSQAELRPLRNALADRDAALERTRQKLLDRQTDLEANLATTRTALQAEQERVRELERVLQETVAALEAERAAADEARASAAHAATQRARASAVPAPSGQPTTVPLAADPDTPVATPVSAPPPGQATSARRGEPRWTAPMQPGARTLGWIAAALVLLGIVWFGVHRAPRSPPTTTAAALPKPGAVLRDCPQCPDMTVLPTGRFKQGSATGSGFTQPLHVVLIERPFALSTNPVTVEDFGPFAAATGRNMQGCDVFDGEWQHRPEASWKQPGFEQTGSHPVTCVSWQDAEAYAQWLSDKTGHRYRLPSASEWEYAALAGSEDSKPWAAEAGACADADVADASAARRYPGLTVFPCDDGYVYTAPVRSFKSNAWGLNDMLGNVLVWTEDCWHPSYVGAPVDGSAWRGGDCAAHELRGGSWFSAPSSVRAHYRDHFPADYRTSSVGLRLVRELAP